MSRLREALPEGYAHAGPDEQLPPFPYDPRVIANGPHPLSGFAMAVFAAAYFVSLLSYLSLHGHQREEDATLDTSSGRARERLKRAA